MNCSCIMVCHETASWQRQIDESCCKDKKEIILYQDRELHGSSHLFYMEAERLHCTEEFGIMGKKN